MRLNVRTNYNSQVNVAETASKRKIKMSFNKFKATVRKLSELSWPDLRDLFTWPSGGSTLQADNPNLLIAKATKNGEVVAYVAAEPILLVDSYTFNPASDPSDTARAGD